MIIFHFALQKNISRRPHRLLIAALILTVLFISSCSNKSEKLQGYLYLRLSSNPTTLDPALIADVTGGVIGAKIFNGLVRLDEKLSVVPDIAKNWKMSGDGKSYTFYLKEKILFSNGKEVAAQDFKYSFERLLAPATRSPNTWVLEKIKGAKDFIKGRTKDVSGIKIEDKYTITIILEEPFTPFLNLLCMTAAYVIPKEDVEMWGADFSTHP